MEIEEPLRGIIKLWSKDTHSDVELASFASWLGRGRTEMHKQSS